MLFPFFLLLGQQVSDPDLSADTHMPASRTAIASFTPRLSALWRIKARQKKTVTLVRRGISRYGHQEWKTPLPGSDGSLF
jgi:hypothetical protein